MARIRTIKPEFWTDDALTECSLSARLLFIGTWNFADDNGNIERSAKQIKCKIFPADNLEVAPLIEELLRHQLLVEYEVSGKKYLHIRTFKDHQVINRPSKTALPLYEPLRRTHGGLTEDSRREGKGKERKGKEEKPTTAARTKTELSFLTAFEEKELDLKRLFPQHDYEVVKEGILAHWRNLPPPADPYQHIYKWFQREQVGQPTFQSKARKGFQGISDDLKKTFYEAD